MGAPGVSPLEDTSVEKDETRMTGRRVGLGFTIIDAGCDGRVRFVGGLG